MTNLKRRTLTEYITGQDYLGLPVKGITLYTIRWSPKRAAIKGVSAPTLR